MFTKREAIVFWLLGVRKRYSICICCQESLVTNQSLQGFDSHLSGGYTSVNTQKLEGQCAWVFSLIVNLFGLSWKAAKILFIYRYSQNGENQPSHGGSETSSENLSCPLALWGLKAALESYINTQQEFRVSDVGNSAQGKEG